MSGKVYVGCGSDRREGFIHCDIRGLEGVDLVCEAWNLSNLIQNVEEVYSRHMLEHLTNSEVLATLRDWLCVLQPKGKIYVVVPNLDFHIEQWKNTNWDKKSFEDPNSEANHSFAGFYGWQRECDPLEADYTANYWDVHKSGFNSNRMSFLLDYVGFENITIQVKNRVHLVATAEKPES